MDEFVESLCDSVAKARKTRIRIYRKPCTGLIQRHSDLNLNLLSLGFPPTVIVIYAIYAIYAILEENTKIKPTLLAVALPGPTEQGIPSLDYYLSSLPTKTNTIFEYFEFHYTS